jgi:hypothetical protein
MVEALQTSITRNNSDNKTKRDHGTKNKNERM